VAITDAPGKARALYDARRDRRQIKPFTDDDPTLGLADGYAVQKELVELLLADGDTVVGYKVGLTSKPMQRMIGVDSPDFAPILASTVYGDGDAVSMSTLIQPKMEAEVIAVMGSRLQGPGVLVTETSPPSKRASRRVTLRPSPVPPTCRVSDCCTCQKGSKICSTCSGAMPIPVSMTRKRSASNSTWTSRRISPRSV